MALLAALSHEQELRRTLQPRWFWQEPNLGHFHSCRRTNLNQARSLWFGLKSEVWIGSQLLDLRSTTLMRKFASIVVLSLAMSSLALAQSSGSFSASIANTACTLNTSTGQIGNGLPGGTVISTTVQTPNSASTALDIRFSAVTGLFTDTKVSNTVSTSTAVAGVTVFATIDGQPIAPNKTCSAGA